MTTSISASPGPDSAGQLAGRRIVITGAASGIGRTTAQLCAREGASVALFDRDADGLATIAEATLGHPFQIDITDDASVANAVNAAAAAMRGIDGVINVAGIHLRGSVQEVSTADFRRVIDVNLTAIYTVVRHCLDYLTAAPFSTIVNVSSAQGLRPDAPNRTAYAASKGGVIALTRALAAELAPHIRANAVCPGLIETPMAEGIVGAANNYALKRLGKPQEIAQAIIFLTSAGSSYVTGATLAVDGGRTFH